MSKLRFVFALSMVGVLAACSSAKTAGNASNEPAISTQHQPVVQAAVDPLNDPNSPLARLNVYFDFDQYTVKSEYQSLLEQHAQYLMQHPEHHVLIQGNTDERGASEYNLALGQKRAEAVRQALTTLGVSDAQLEAVSLGKEKPVVTGHDEASWSQNRRADLNYKQ